MTRRVPIDHLRPRSDRAYAAAHALLEIVFDAEEASADELHRRVWVFLMDQFDDVEREIHDA